jgi:hypothetical protein
MSHKAQICWEALEAISGCTFAAIVAKEVLRMLVLEVKQTWGFFVRLVILE